MKDEHSQAEVNRRIAEEFAEIDKEVGKWVSPAGQGVDLKPDSDTDEITKQLMEEERAFLHPEEWGIDLGPVLQKAIAPPADPDELSDQEVGAYLRRMVDLLARYHLCLTCTNHLSDRELYKVIMEKVLPQPIGIGPNPIGGLLYHECCPCDSDEYLAYYSDDMEREDLAAEFDLDLPAKRPLVSDRDAWIELLAESYRFEPLPEQETADGRI